MLLFHVRAKRKFRYDVQGYPLQIPWGTSRLLFLST